MGLCGNNCDQCNYKNICGGCSFCEASVCSKNCDTCIAICFNRPGASFYISTLGDLEIPLNDRKKMAITIPHHHIPILPDKFDSWPDYDIMPFIAVHGGKLLSRNGEKINPRYLNNGYTNALNIDPRTKAILEFYIKDRPLEGFWDNRKEIYRDLMKLEFEAIISLNFSVYEDAPRIDHLQNIKRSTIVYNELLDKGFNAIPDVSWYNLQDLDRWCKEINVKGIEMIAFSFQVVDVGLKTSNFWKSYLLGFRYLCENISQKVRIIVAGIVSPFKIHELYKASNGQDIYVLNQSAYVQARRGMKSESRLQERDIPFKKLFESNVLYFNKAYSDILFRDILEWPNEKLIDFYHSYYSVNGRAELRRKFGIEIDKLELAFNFVNRVLRKKRIKLRSD